MLIPLTMASPGEYVCLVEILGGKRVRRRLAEMGLNKGLTVQVMASNGDGPLIITVKDSRLAIGRNIAHRILVHPADRPRRSDHQKSSHQEAHCFKTHRFGRRHRPGFAGRWRHHRNRTDK